MSFARFFSVVLAVLNKATSWAHMLLGKTGGAKRCGAFSLLLGTGFSSNGE